MPECAVAVPPRSGSDNIFGQLIQMKQTQRQLVISPGQDKSMQNFDLPGQ